MNSEDTYKINCIITETNEKGELDVSNAASEKIVIDEQTFDGKAEPFTSATIAPEIDAALRKKLEARYTDYAISVKESNKDKSEVAEK